MVHLGTIVIPVNKTAWGDVQQSYLLIHRFPFLPKTFVSLWSARSLYFILMCLDNSIMSNKKILTDHRCVFLWFLGCFLCLLNVKQALKPTDYVCLDWIWQDSYSLKQLSSWGWILGFELIFLAAQEATGAYPMLCLFFVVSRLCFHYTFRNTSTQRKLLSFRRKSKGKKPKTCSLKREVLHMCKCILSENGNFGKLRWWNLCRI